ncbi:hypothetical protein GCM10009734_28670 [Nonomuraea bangladeshensis]
MEVLDLARPQRSLDGNLGALALDGHLGHFVGQERRKGDDAARTNRGYPILATPTARLAG